MTNWWLTQRPTLGEINFSIYIYICLIILFSLVRTLKIMNKLLIELLFTYLNNNLYFNHVCLFLRKWSFISTRYITTRPSFASQTNIDSMSSSGIPLLPAKERSEYRRGCTLAGAKIFPKLSSETVEDENDDNVSPHHTTPHHTDPPVRVFVLRKVVGRAVADSSLRWSYNLHLSDRRFIPSCRRKLFPPFPPSILLSRNDQPSSVLPSPFATALENRSRDERIESARCVNTRITRCYDIRCSSIAARDYALRGLRDWEYYSGNIRKW